MTPIGHISASYISASLINRVSVSAAIIGAIVPDLDFLFIGFEWFNAYHHVTTHNIFYIAIAALIAYVIADKNSRAVVALSLFFGGLLHLLIDACMDTNYSNGVGITLFWPLYDGHFSPFNICSDSGVSAGWGEPLKMVKPMMTVVLFESPLYLISLFLYAKARRASIQPP